ncbi:MAG: succinylglutamate desuccinylase/aspartoacylase family protein [Rhodothermales bacterium]|nr:succinylglutamate desuccinylase/aspartoacylase family protein [Rhodothermales bacterium]MBO6778612.1 succinylglutamate desuccinylase/aspartoacylase family protein [Rhodothermales bacterium]
MSDALEIAGTRVEPGSRQTVLVPLAPMYTSMDMVMPTHVVRGKKDGPVLFVSAAIHGDEINGVEIIRQLLGRPDLARLRGTLIAVPVVNVYGYTFRSRYLPDRRDLNRSFPGSASGSMASRMAHTFMEEVAEKATHGIDLHTGAVHRTNLPHVRVNFENEDSLKLAHAFRAPLIMHSTLRDGSLREAGHDLGIPMLLYEAGEALRFDRQAIRVGLRGVLTVMRSIGMLPATKAPKRRVKPVLSTGSRWVRAPDSGTLLSSIEVGDVVQDDQVMGYITDPLGGENIEVRATASGVVVGKALLPLVYEGEALFNIALVDNLKEFGDRLDRYESNLSGDPDLPPDLDAVLAHDPVD